MFTVMGSHPGPALLDLDNGACAALLLAAADAKFVPTGHPVFLRQGMLIAVRFDAAALKVAGQPFPIVENVMQALVPWGGQNTGAGQFDVSCSDSLVYEAGGVFPDL